MTLSKQEKLKRGYYRPDREPSGIKTQALDHIPEPKMKLSDRQRQIYEAICQELINSGRLKVEYIRLITRMAVNWELLEKARENLEEHGPVNVSNTGYIQVNGYFSAWSTLDKRISEFEAKFGLDLSSNEKLNIKEPEKPDQLDKLLKKSG